MMIDRPGRPVGKINMSLAPRMPGYRRKASLRAGSTTRLWVVISLVLHLLLAVGLWRHGAKSQVADEKPPIYADIVMIQKHDGAVAPEAKFTSGTGQDTGPRGDAQPAAKAEPQHAAPSPSRPPSQPQAAPPPKPPDADAPPIPPAAPASQPAPPAPPSESQQASVAAPPSPAANPPQTNLGDDVDVGNWQITGRHVSPPGIDSTVHNVPPVYPAEAVRAAEEGTVTLLVTVSPDGSAEKIDVSSSSGYERLDRAARDAVARWHFTPGQQDGIAVESLYPVKINFALKK
jgi:protein TonB